MTEQQTDYAAVVTRAFDRIPAARAEGGIEANDFDLAYQLAKQELGEAGLETDTNALFYALTAEQQKRDAAGAA